MTASQTDSPTGAFVHLIVLLLALQICLDRYAVIVFCKSSVSIAAENFAILSTGFAKLIERYTCHRIALSGMSMVAPSR